MALELQTRPVIEPCPDNPGWTTFNFPNPEQYNGAVIGNAIARVEEGQLCRVRFQPKPFLTNAFGQVHGGGILGMIDVSLFAALRFVAGHHTGGVTLDLSTQFIGAGTAETQTDAVVEVLRQTRQLVFVRGKIEQSYNLVAAYSGTIRKVGDAAR